MFSSAKTLPIQSNTTLQLIYSSAAVKISHFQDSRATQKGYTTVITCYNYYKTETPPRIVTRKCL